MKKEDENVEVARITSRQAIVVALITAIAGILAGYFGKPSSGSGTEEIAQAYERIAVLEAKLQSVENGKAEAEKVAAESRFALQELKQRVRDILGPKERFLRRMGQSLERMKSDPGVSEFHRERLSEIAQELDAIDSKVMTIVEN